MGKIFAKKAISWETRKLPPHENFPHTKISTFTVRGSFKKFCYVWLPVRKKRIYASLILCILICHSIIHRHMKYQRNQANINNVMCIQNSLSHIHWPLFEGEKGERVEIGVSFHKKSCCIKTFAPKREVEQTYEYNALCMTFKSRIKGLKVAYFQ